ncbi:MAG: hypothetical protein J0M20_06335 [Burkholderiales bacterium]|nr:hypothetical protein [Burkholderiales bacterium]
MSSSNSSTPPETSYARFDEQGQLVPNLARWTSIADESRKWRGRYRILAGHVAPGSAVIEFGCGDMALRDMLPPGCHYQPSDIVARSADSLVIDLDGELPSQLPRHYEVAVLSGVLEYVRDPAHALRWATSVADQVLFSYATLEDFPDLDKRHRIYGWFNHLNHLQVLALEGLQVETIGRWHRQNLYRARRA